MGTHYGSIHIRTENSAVVKKVLDGLAKETKCKFLLGPPMDGWTCIFPEHGGQNSEISAGIAKKMSADIFQLIVHDDDIFSYYFYRDGKLVDRYNSCPDYFHAVSAEEKIQCQGHPESFQDLLAKANSLKNLRALLATGSGGDFTFEQVRMERFVKLLGISNALSNYEYLQAGELEGIKEWKKFIHIPNPSAENAAKRAIELQIKAQQKQLQEQGLFLAEITAPLPKGSASPISLAWGIDSSTNGVVFAGQSFEITKPFDDETAARELFILKPPWNIPAQRAGIKTNWTSDIFCTSPSGKWLAGGFVAGDWTARVWDWATNDLAFTIAHSGAVQWLAFSQDDQWLYSLGGEEFNISSLSEKRVSITISGLKGSRAAAVHPSNAFLVIGLQNQLWIIDLKTKIVVKKLAAHRKTEKLERWRGLTNDQVMEKLRENPQKLKKAGLESKEDLESWINQKRWFSFESQESIFDVRFSPDGKGLFMASTGMRIFDWNEVLSAEKNLPPPRFFVDAPRDDENDPNSHPLTYSIRFDPERKILLSSCLAGTIQYLNIENGNSGTLLKIPGEVTSWRLELTTDGKALCCQCASRPSIRDVTNRFNRVQVWNYPALCAAAGLD
jgi:WD40 repeat protein